MEDLFNVNAFRNKLIDYYTYACDNTKESQEKRRKAIEKYDDNYLEEIIENVYTFCLYILEKLKENLIEGETFFSFRLEENKIFLYNYYIGGGRCDDCFYLVNFQKIFGLVCFYLNHFLRDVTYKKMKK